MFALGTTDLDWHAQLSAEPPVGVANYWTPTPWRVRLAPGSRWFFMLKKPIRRIGGFGTLRRYEESTVSETWRRYGRANGVQSIEDLRTRLGGYIERRSKAGQTSDPVIGGVVLEDCVFLPPSLQVAPQDLGLAFASSIVKWKGFPGELELPYERGTRHPGDAFELVSITDPDSEMRRVKKRIGQPRFRAEVLDAYGDTCAFTGTCCREALDAAHIQPFRSMASNHVQNGLALRRDVHCLFDAGLLGVSEHGRILVSETLAATEYAALAGKVVGRPLLPGHRPAPAALAFHRTQTFRVLRRP